MMKYHFYCVDCCVIWDVFDIKILCCTFFDDGPYIHRSIWNDDICCCFGNIKTIDQTLVELEQLRI